MSLNERMKQIREDNRLPLRAFGDKIGMSGANVSRIEKGERSVTDRTIKLLCNEFGLSEEWIRTGEGDKYPVMTYDEELAVVMANIMSNEDDTTKRIIMKLSKLSDAQLLMIDNMLAGIIPK